MLGNTPYIARGSAEDVRALFQSNESNALFLSIHIPAGYGFLHAGTILGKISESTNRLAQYVPYAPEQPPLGGNAAAAYLVADGAASAIFYIGMDDSYRFAVGDHLVAADNTNYNAEGSGATDLGAITAIDRTTYSHMAKITATNNVTTAHTVALGGCVWIQTMTTAPFTKAAGVLMTSVETGTGVNAKGADAVIVLSNAILNKSALRNYDSEVLTDLSGVEHGKFLILK